MGRSSASADSGGGVAQGAEPIVELGARGVRTFAARIGGELVVVQRAHCNPRNNDAHDAQLARDSRALIHLRHPNVSRVRNVTEVEEDVVITSDFVTGEPYADLARGQFPLGLHLRALVDVLAGIGAIHAVRDGSKSLGFVHGDLSSENVIVGIDGVARVLQPIGVIAQTEHTAAELRFLAPEILLGDDTTDLRADVFSVGVMLWEAIAGRPIFQETNAGAILSRHLGGKLDPLMPSQGDAWANALIPLALKAIATDPGARYASANELSSDLWKVARTRIGSPGAVAAAVRSLAGDKIAARERRIHLLSGAPLPAAAVASWNGAEDTHGRIATRAADTRAELSLGDLIDDLVDNLVTHHGDDDKPTPIPDGNSYATAAPTAHNLSKSAPSASPALIAPTPSPGPTPPPARATRPLTTSGDVTKGEGASAVKRPVRLHANTQMGIGPLDIPQPLDFPDAAGARQASAAETDSEEIDISVPEANDGVDVTTGRAIVTTSRRGWSPPPPDDEIVAGVPPRWGRRRTAVVAALVLLGAIGIGFLVRLTTSGARTHVSAPATQSLSQPAPPPADEARPRTNVALPVPLPAPLPAPPPAPPPAPSPAPPLAPSPTLSPAPRIAAGGDIGAPAVNPPSAPSVSPGGGTGSTSKGTVPAPARSTTTKKKSPAGSSGPTGTYDPMGI